MKKILFYLIALVVIPTSFLSSQIYAKTYHIMLQGFHWRSSFVSEGWDKIIHDNSQRIKDSGFTLIWLPPPSKSTSPQGYEPNQLNNLTSAYGTENHDTEEARNSQYAPPFPGGDQMILGYAFILTHPGTPCIFWKDIYDSGKLYEDKIEELILIRKKYLVHSESRVWIDKAEKNYGYAAYIQGDKGEIALKIGPGSWSPSGDKWDPIGDLLTSGNDYAVWGEYGRWPN